MQLIPSLRRIHIKKSERALLLRNGDFERVLRPGRHWLFNWFDALRVEVFATEQAALSHGLSDCLMNLEPAAVAADFLPVTLGESQVALRFQNDLLVELHLPGSRRLFWLGVHKQRVEVLNLGAWAAEICRLRVSDRTSSGWHRFSPRIVNWRSAIAVGHL